MDTKPIIRAKHYHGGSKGRIVGNNVKPAPAWRESATNEAGSKVLLSNLPVDVSETEITVSHIYSCFFLFQDCLFAYTVPLVTRTGRIVDIVSVH